MDWKYLFFVLMFLSFSGGMAAQQSGVLRRGFAAAGGVVEGASARVSFSVGQSGVIGGSVGLRQGFQQPDARVQLQTQAEVPAWLPFPNPTTTEFELNDAPQGPFTLELRTVDGRVVAQWTVAEAGVFALPAGLAPGVYLLVEPKSGHAVRLQCAGS